MLNHNWKSQMIVRALYARKKWKSWNVNYIFWSRNFLIIHNLHIPICVQNWAHRVETIWISVPNNFGARSSSDTYGKSNPEVPIPSCILALVFFSPNILGIIFQWSMFAYQLKSRTSFHKKLVTTDLFLLSYRKFYHWEPFCDSASIIPTALWT